MEFTKSHVGPYTLLRQSLRGLPLALLLTLQLLGHLPVALRLGAQVVDYAVEEVLRQLGIELLGRDGAVSHRLVGFPSRPRQTSLPPR